MGKKKKITPGDEGITSEVKIQNHRVRNSRKDRLKRRMKEGESEQWLSLNGGIPPGSISQWFVHTRDSKSFPNLHLSAQSLHTGKLTLIQKKVTLEHSLTCICDV